MLLHVECQEETVVKYLGAFTIHSVELFSQGNKN